MTRPVLARPARILQGLNMAMCLLFVAVGLCTGWALIWGPAKVHSGQSMLLVRGLGLPWVYWGVFFLAYSVLLLSRRTRTGGYITGFVLFGFFTVSLIVAAFQGHLGSAPLLAMAICASAGQVSAAIRSMVTAGER